MADSFFGFDTSLTGVELDEGPDVDDEEQYDALNNETFGSDAFQGDWESDHTRFAQVTESGREYHNSYNSDKDDEDLDLETTLSQLVLDELDDEPSLERRQPDTSGYWRPPQTPTAPGPSKPLLPPQLPRIPTVQELERDMLHSKASKPIAEAVAGRGLTQRPSQGPPPGLHPLPPQQGAAMTKFPPGLHPLQGPNITKYPPGLAVHHRQAFAHPSQHPDMAAAKNKHLLPPHMIGKHPLFLHPLVQMPPYLLPPMHPLQQANHLKQPGLDGLRNGQVAHHHMAQGHIGQRELMAQSNNMIGQRDHLAHANMINLGHMTPTHNMNLGHMTPTHNMNLGHALHGQWNQQNILNHNNRAWLLQPDNTEEVDEYAGFMNYRERQWLLKIQMLQLQTDKPHVDDYYYTKWLKKQENLKKEREQNGLSQGRKKEPFFANNRRERRDSDREQLQPGAQRVYEPLQFENSLGKLQCGSVTAPRKIIDMDLVAERVNQPSNQTPSQPSSHKDSRKAKKILLELERLYLLVMELEEIGQMCIGEEVQGGSKEELLSKILAGLLAEDYFISFMCIRKGKNLLLRVLPHLDLTRDHFELAELWTCLARGLPTIARRDHADLLLLKLYPYLKEWLLEASEAEVVGLTKLLVPSNHSLRISPNPAKAPLVQCLASKLGVGLVSLLLCRGEFIFHSLSEDSKQDWRNFLVELVKYITCLPTLDSVPRPMEPIPQTVLVGFMSRLSGLTSEQLTTAQLQLTKVFTLSNVTPS